MKKSNKGFTLIELLASVVLLGILFGLGIPVLTSMVTSNRDKIYVNDAKKLMSQAEYKIKAASTVIEKPSAGDCIVISMIYLESTDFDVAPNRGEYIRDASYVVVKNNAGTLEYSAAIVEKLKDGSYKGIELTSESLLRGSNAIKYVGPISTSDLKIVESKEDNDVTVEYINSRMKKVAGIDTNYVTDIEHIYNNPDLEDEATTGGSEPPVITKASLASASGKNYNSLDATLTVSAEDKDTPKNKLKVYISRVGYDDALEHQTAMDYGTTGSFVKEYDFGSEGYAYGDPDKSKVVLYIVVKDDKDNTDKTMIVYNIHMNEPPEIGTKSKIEKLPTDKVSRVVGLVTLDVTDDIDKVENLKFCLTENANATECTNYKSYNETFNYGQGQFTYSFSNNKCDLNGQTKSLNVFVKDVNGLVNNKVLNYTIYKDKAPTFAADNPITVVPVTEAFSSVGSLNVRIIVKGSDEASYNSDMKVYISDGGTEKEYDFDPSNEMDYLLAGTYDGAIRNINIRLKDECGNYSETKTYPYPVYGNEAPVIEGLSVESKGSACLNDYPCDDSIGGNRNVRVNFRVTDDIDYDDLSNKISVCWGQYDTYCCETKDASGNCTKLKNTKKYSEAENGASFAFDTTNQKPYTGQNSVKNFYVFAQDSYGKISKTELSGGYKLYTNQAPKIDDFVVRSDPNSTDTYFTTEESLDVAMFIEASDDLTNFNDLSYEIKSDGQKIYTAANSTTECKGTLTNYDEAIGIKCHLNGGYDGKARKITLTLTDSYGKTVTTTDAQAVSYMVYQNQAPKILKMPKGDEEETDDDTGGEDDDGTEEDGDDITVTDVEPGADIAPRHSDCNQNYKCPYFGSEGGSADVTLLFDLEDDIDRVPTADIDEETGESTYSYEDPTRGLKICTFQTLKTVSFNPDSNYCTNTNNFVSYAEFLNNEREFTFPSYDGKDHVLYIYAMDSFGATDYVAVDYKIYQNLPPEFAYMNDNDEKVTSIPSIHTTETNRFGNDSETNLEADDTSGDDGTSEEGTENLDLYKGLNRIKKAVFEIQAMDDFDEQVNLRFKICYKLKGSSGSGTCQSTFAEFSPTGYQVEINAPTYSGQTYEVFAYVQDSLGLQSTGPSESVEYTLYNDVNPILKSVSASFTEADLAAPEEEPEVELECVFNGNKYYGPNGEELADEDEYIEKCISTDGKFYCVKYRGQYYNNVGEVVTEEEYNESCAVDEPEEPEETYICERVAKPNNGGYTYYGPTGQKLNNRNEYLRQCEGYAIGPSTNASGQKVKFSIIVQDPYDTYTVCINKTGETCESGDYVGLTSTKGFDGTSLDPAYVYFVEPQGLKYTENEERYDQNGNLIEPYDDEGNPTPTQTGETTKTVKNSESTYYVFIRDSSGKMAERITSIIEDDEFANCEDNDTCPAICETANNSANNDGKGTCSSVVASEYEECGELEYNFYKSEFIHYPRNGKTTPISASLCSGMCYYAEAKDEFDYVDPEVPTIDEEEEGGEGENTIDESEKVFNTSEIFAYYQKKLFYKDRFDSTKACDTKNSLEEYDDEESTEENPSKVSYKKHYCSFVGCFKQDLDTTNYGEYEVKAIGTFKRTIPLTETISYTDLSTGETYESQNYHMIYLSSYDGKSDTIDLNPTNYKMVPKAYESETSIYRYRSSETNYDNYYVRVRD